MRLWGKPLIEESGYPWIGVVTLLKESNKRTFSNGKECWSAFVEFEKKPKNAPKNLGNVVGITTGFDTELAKKLIAWPKGTRLLIAGSMKYSDYWTQKNGQKTYQVEVEWVHDQHDYAAVEKAEQGHADAYESGDYGNDDAAVDYDVDF